MFVKVSGYVEGGVIKRKLLNKLKKGEGTPVARLFREKAEGQPLSFPQYVNNSLFYAGKQVQEGSIWARGFF